MVHDRTELRVAVLGAGSFGRSHGRAYQQVSGVRVVAVAVADARPEVAQAAAQDLGVGQWFSDVNRLLERVKPDAVSIVAAPDQNLALTAAAVRSGAAVLLEKPVLSDTSDIDALDRISADGIVVPAHVLRFTTEYQDEWVTVRSLASLLNAIETAATRFDTRTSIPPS